MFKEAADIKTSDHFISQCLMQNLRLKPSEIQQDMVQALSELQPKSTAVLLTLLWIIC